jgi:ABC-type transport system involved in cytochrome bd biosynthesis fused ATPase/permease subunit
MSSAETLAKLCPALRRTNGSGFSPAFSFSAYSVSTAALVGSRTQAAPLDPGQPVTVTPAAGPPYGTTSSTSAGLRKSFGKLKVVEGLSLQVAAGEICGFLGANGSGKTTAIRMLCGLLKPDGGRRECLGYNIIRQPNEIRRQVDYMTQRSSLMRT